MRRCGPKIIVALLGVASLSFLTAQSPPPTTQPDTAAINEPGLYIPVRLRTARTHELSRKLISDRRVWLARWFRGTSSDLADAIHRAVSAAEFQAITLETAYKPVLLAECRRVVSRWPEEPDAYQTFVTNPEPRAVTLARTAALNPEARDILRPILESLLKQLHDGAHGWNADYGKTTLCRVRLQQALGMPCDPIADYGRNRGLRWMLSHVDDGGWAHWSIGSPWYQIFNDVIVPIGWDVRNKLTDEEQKKFLAVYYFPFYWQADGASPLIGEDRIENRIKRYRLWTGYASRWRGSDEISTYMRWRALHELGFPVQFDDLFCPPTPDWCPPQPPLPPESNFTRAVIKRGPTTVTVQFSPTGPSIDGAHRGEWMAESYTVEIKSRP